MFKKYWKYVIVVFFLAFSASASALDYSKLPKIIQTNIEKQYRGQEIKVLSVKKTGKRLTIIVQTTSGKDKIVVDQSGKIISISEYLEGMEPTGGC